MNEEGKYFFKNLQNKTEIHKQIIVFIKTFLKEFSFAKINKFT